MNQEVLIEKVVVNLLRLAVTKLPIDVKQALENAYKTERSLIGKTQLKTMLDNIEVAEEIDRPICQDTGLINFYIDAGVQFKHLHCLERILRNAVRKATIEIPLRPNALNPLTQTNTGNNVGKNVPYIHWRLVDGNMLKITAFPKGGGSENTCVLKMMTPSEGLEGLKRFVIKKVVEAAGMPCPPTIIGIGFGGGANIAMELAKIALLKPINQPNPDKAVAELEHEIYLAVNKTGIGPMGLGGDYTTIAVNVEYAHRHPASYPVAVAFQCWAARRATASIQSNGDVEYLSHEV